MLLILRWFWGFRWPLAFHDLDVATSLWFCSCVLYTRHPPRPPADGVMNAVFQACCGSLFSHTFCWFCGFVGRVFRPSWSALALHTDALLAALCSRRWPIGSPLAAANGEAARRVDLHFYYSIAGASSSCSSWSQANYKCNYEWERGLIWMLFTADFRGSADCWVTEVPVWLSMLLLLKLIHKSPIMRPKLSQRHTRPPLFLPHAVTEQCGLLTSSHRKNKLPLFTRCRSGWMKEALK